MLLNPFYDKVEARIPLEPEHYSLVEIGLRDKFPRDNTFTYALNWPQFSFLKDQHRIEILHHRVVLIPTDHADARGFIGKFLKWPDLVAASDYDMEEHRAYLNESTRYPWLFTRFTNTQSAYHFADENDAVMFHLAFADTYLKQSRL